MVFYSTQCTYIYLYDTLADGAGDAGAGASVETLRVNMIAIE